MIDPTEPVKASGNAQSTYVQPAATPEKEARKSAKPAEAGQAEVKVPERQKEASPANSPFDVRLDSKTMKLYTELRDPETQRLIMRIPAGYQPSGEPDSTTSKAASIERVA